MRAFIKGVIDCFAVMMGYIPVGLSFGIAAQHVGFSPWMTMAVSLFIYAGASQFVLLGMVASGSSALNTIIAIVLINLRHLFYGPAIAHFFKASFSKFPLSLLAFGLTDEVFASASSQLKKMDPSERRPWFFGMAVGAYSSWLLGTFLGVILGSWVERAPAWIGETANFVLPALFASLLLEVAHRQMLPILVVAALATIIFAIYLPSHWAMLLGMLGGASVVFIKRKAS